MLVATGIWIYIFILSSLIGLSISRLASKIFNFEVDEAPALSLLVLTGLCVETVIGLYFSLFIKVGLIVNIVLILYALVYLYFDKDYIGKVTGIYFSKLLKVKPATWILAIAVIAFAYLITFCWTLNDDTNSYHAISVKWIENYRAIPGITNLYHRLGFNNAWFITAAIFGLSFFRLMSFNVLSQFLLIFGIFYCLVGINRILSGDFHVSNWVRLFFIPLIYFSYFYPHLGWIVTPSPDIPSAMFIWILFINLLLISEKTGPKYFSSDIFLNLILVLYISIIKLSSAPVFIVFLYILLRLFLDKKIKFGLILTAVAVIIVLPWLIRNIILSGYILYPFPAIDIFNFDWKVPIANAISEKHEIENWAKWPAWFQNTENLKLSDLKFSKWFEIWLKNQTFQYLKILLYGIPILWGLFILYFISKGKKIIGILKENHLAIIGIFSASIGTIYWFLSAPDLRFGWGFMFITFSIMIFIAIHWIFNLFSSKNKRNKNLKQKLKPTFKGILPINKPLYISLSVFFVLIFLGHEYIIFNKVLERMKIFSMKYNSERILTPADYPNFDGKVKSDDNRYIYFGDPNYGILPSAVTEDEIDQCEFRGTKLSDGFRAKQSK